MIALLVMACTKKPADQHSLLPHSIEAGPDEEQARGVVYHDANENGVLDDGEKGISGVAVSNGSDLVQTNAQGEYALPVSDDAIIFIIKPADWMTPVNEVNLPRFYYLHKPGGYPDNFNFNQLPALSGREFPRF